MEQLEGVWVGFEQFGEGCGALMEEGWKVVEMGEEVGGYGAVGEGWMG
jgi:hypothetical protein